MKNNIGNTIIAVAVIVGTFLFVSSFINASLRSFQPSETRGAVKGVFVAQRATYTPEPLPRIDLKANGQDALSIPHNTNFTLSWSGAGISSCTATGQWSGEKAVSGSETKNNGTSTVGQWNSEGTAMVYKPTNFSINYYITCTPSIAGYSNVTDMVVVTGLVPTATPTVAQAPRATNIPQPSPYVKVIVKDTKGVALSLANATVCSGTWGGQILSNKISTSNCVNSPASSFNIPFDQYRSFGANSGIFVKLPSGWTFTSVTSPDNEGDLVLPTSLTDERGEIGKPIGWSTGYIPLTGYYTLVLVVQQPPSYGYIKQGDVLTRVTYYQGQAASAACGNVTAITTCNASPTMTGAPLAQCTISDTVYSIYSNGLCPSPTPAAATPTPPEGCEYIAEACTESIPPNCVYKLSCTSPKPACAKNCALQPKGDASCNLVIDSEDYTIWRNNLDNNVGVGTSPKEGPDFNNDGKVNLTDLQKWQDGLFTPPPTPSGACAVPTSSVEPASPTPTLGAGCFYNLVECVQAPCQPVVVCPTATSCPVPQCAAPPAGCSYNKTNNCSCGKLVCGT